MTDLAYPTDGRSTTEPNAAVPTFAALRALTPALAAAVTVGGYAVVGDGRGGVFYWSQNPALVDDDENIVLANGNPTAGGWIRAAGDGVTTVQLPSDADFDMASRPPVSPTIFTRAMTIASAVPLTAARVLTVPFPRGGFLVRNATTPAAQQGQPVTLRASANGASVSIAYQANVVVFSDGTNLY